MPLLVPQTQGEFEGGELGDIQREEKSWAECYIICVLALNRLLIELFQFSGVTSVAKVIEKTQQKCRLREMKNFSFTFTINYILF